MKSTIKEVTKFKIEFPSSGWTLQLSEVGDSIVFDLLWNNKEEPTHQAVESKQDIKRAIDILTFVHPDKFPMQKRDIQTELATLIGQELEPIPEDVYWCAPNANFYDAITNKGMGEDFYRKWWRRASEFKQDDRR